MYKSIFRPLLFKSDPESIHHRVFNFLKLIHKIPGKAAGIRAIYKLDSPELMVNVFGLEFPNPVGLAAGFDKDGKLYNELANFGFGFIEVGTVTPRPQAGNPKPRMFRLPEDKAIINRMGFNNEGVDALKSRLEKYPAKNIIIGGNIGKNKDTPNENALDDYLYCFRALYDVVDYFVVNVSSPNTPGLRSLQEKGPLLEILKSLQDENLKKRKAKPILLKIAPDLTNSQLDDIIEIVNTSRISGIIATNTTIERGGLKTAEGKIKNIGTGGLSGRPLTKRSTEVIQYLSEKSNQQIPIIAVGGIFTADDAMEKIKAGASLVQVYTGFIYEGPSIVKNINKGILKSKKLT